eukprot:gnl/Spiro4/8870_TR4681_c0_g1_i1.p1 gnl/Spiro4/8870_TR4681_c0_g1~~gnl/Spiro4/8870_TR4681_c0_g1_i1.p1  ORF type:complete len:265 (-),score=62.84 gnl/Spiro4/8870_TR4681_c0_g1_i1:130-876(-)
MGLLYTLYRAFPLVLVGFLGLIMSAVLGFVPYWVVFLIFSILIYRAIRVPAWLADVPGPSSFESLRDLVSLSPYDRTIKYQRKYGRVFKLWVGRWILVVGDPDLVKEIVTNHNVFEKRDIGFFPEFSHTHRFFGGFSLVSANGDIWARQSQALRSSFAFDSLRDMYPTFQLVVGEMLELLARAGANDTDVDIYNAAQRFTLAVLGRSVFSFDFKTLATWSETLRSARLKTSKCATSLQRMRQPAISSL